jgi:hypothetical protein
MENQPPISETRAQAVGMPVPYLGSTSDSAQFYFSNYASERDKLGLLAILNLDRRPDNIIPNAHTQANQLARLGAAALFNTPTLGRFTGGSLVSTYAGFQTAAASSGWYSYTPAGAQSWFGHGALTDSVAFRLTENMQRQFFTNGINQIGQTGGLNRTEMGLLVNSLAARGAFAGMRAGNLVNVTTANRDTLANRAAASGATEETVKTIKSMTEGAIFDVDPGFVQRVNDKIRDAAKAIGAVKDVIGGRPMEELVRVMESIGGGSAASSVVSRNAAMRMAGISSLAAAFGRDPTSMVQDVLQTVDLGRAMGFSRKTSASFAYAANRSAVLGSQAEKAARILTGDREGVSDAMTEAEMRQRYMVDLAGASTSEGMRTILAIRDYQARYAGALSKADQERLDAAINDITSSYGKGRLARKEADAAGAKIFRGITGTEVGNYLAMQGGVKKVLARTDITDYADMFNREMAFEGNGQFRRATDSFYASAPSELKAILGSQNDFFRFGKYIRGKASVDQLATIKEALELNMSDDEKRAAVTEILKKSRFTAEGAKENADTIVRMGAGAFQDMVSAFYDDDATRGIASQGDLAATREREAAAYFKRIYQFGDAKSPISMFGRFAAGFVGANDIGDSGRLKLALAGMSDAEMANNKVQYFAAEDGSYKHTSGDYSKLDAKQKAELANIGIRSDEDLALAASGDQRNTVAMAMMKGRTITYSDKGDRIFVDTIDNAMTKKGGELVAEQADKALGIKKNINGAYRDGELELRRREAVKDKLSKIGKGDAEISSAALAIAKDDAEVAKMIKDSLEEKREKILKKDNKERSKEDNIILSTYDRAAELTKAAEDETLKVRLSFDGGSGNFFAELSKGLWNQIK